MNTTNTSKPTIAATVEGAVLTLTYSTGEVVTVNAGELSEDVRQRAMMHGLKQKIVDAAAISRNPETGRSATTADKKAACDEVVARLHAGEWNKNREGGGGGGSLLLMALVQMYAGKQTREAIAAHLDTLTDKEKSALRSSPKIARIIFDIKASRGADSGVDADALLGELGML